jgi:hypothetical protein
VRANETAGPVDDQSHQPVDLDDEAETTWPLACLFRTDLRADRSDRYGAGYGPMDARASGRYRSRFTCGSDSEMYQVKGKSRATLTDGASTPLEDARFSRRVRTTFCAHCTNPGMEKY